MIADRPICLSVYTEAAVGIGASKGDFETGYFAA